jgi:hypothetical protein
MKTINISILENMEIYGKRLASYISRYDESPFSVRLYLEHPVQTEAWQKADVILISSSLLQMYEAKTEDGRLLILDESGDGLNDERHVFIYKYQSAELIYQQLLHFCVEKSNKNIIRNGKGKKEFVLTGVYTPVRGERSMRSVLAMCRSMAVHCKVLYLNLEQVTVFWEYLEGDDRQEGLSELLYYVKQHKRNIGTRIEMMTVKEAFDYLLPTAIPAEIDELTEEDWLYFVNALKIETAYEKVIVDFGTSLPSAVFLEACSDLLIISDESAWEEKLVGQFEKNLKRLMGDSVVVTIRKESVDRILSKDIWMG